VVRLRHVITNSWGPHVVAAIGTLALSVGAVGAVGSLGDDDSADGADIPTATTAASTETTAPATEAHGDHTATTDAPHTEHDTGDDGDTDTVAHTEHDTGDTGEHDPAAHDPAAHDPAAHDPTDHDGGSGSGDNHDGTDHGGGHDDPGTTPGTHGHPKPPPDPCAGHVPNPDPTDPCNQVHCSSDDVPGVHAQHALAASTQDCAPVDPCAGHVHTDDPNDPCNPPCGDDDGGGGGHHDHALGAPDCPTVQYGDLPPEVQAVVDLGTNVAIQYPTGADAEAAGWYQRTIYFPGIATHYLRTEWLDGVFEPTQPEVLLYGRDGQLVGFNYIVVSDGPPEGFPGDDDVWHEHPTLCVDLDSGLIIGGEDLTVPRCARRGGTVIDFSGRWLLHVWTVPGYDSPEGVFSHENSRV